jgi:hypothetical protein
MLITNFQISSKDQVVMKRITLRFFTVICFSIILLANPLHVSSAPETKEKKAVTIRVDSIAVVPFFKGKDIERIDDPMNKTLSCPLVGLCFNEDSYRPGAEKKVERYAYDVLKKKFNERLVPFEEVIQTYAGLVIDPQKDTPRIVAQKVGKALRTEYVLVGAVWRYTDRIAENGSTKIPASVAFVMYLVHVETGERLWKKAFEKTQKTLTENVLEAKDFFQQGARWLTADELARFGAKKILKDFPAY